MAESTLKIYDGDKLIVDAVYCRNNDTGEVGWYDHVGEKFHPTPLPGTSGLQWIDTGVQYIDTGIDPASLRPKGEWVQVIYHVEFVDGFTDRLYECCSRCHKPNGRRTSDFCPNCGADMRGNPNDS